MMNGRMKSVPGGFSLVELLVVMAIMGLVMTSVYGLYITNQRTAYTQDEVVDLQQNLRVSMDMISTDIRNTGFMVSAADFPIASATNNSVTINVGTPVNRFAIITSDFQSPADATTPVQIDIESPDMADYFDTTGSYNTVRIMRPYDKSQPIEAVFKVDGKNRSGPWIKLKGFTTSSVDYKEGDIIVSAVDGLHPQTIAYVFSSGTMTKSINGGTAEVIATEIDDVDFAYLDDDGTWSTTVSGSSLGDIRAVSVSIEGNVDVGKGEIKRRTMNSVISIRNR